MRPKDASKKDALFRATQQIVIDEGFASVTMSKIARAARVAPATLYTYFENKDELLNELFINLHAEMLRSVAEPFPEMGSYEEWFRAIWRNIYNFFIENPEDFEFCHQFQSSPRMRNLCCHEQFQQQVSPIKEIIIRGQQEGVMKNLPREAMHTFVFSPMVELARMKLSGEIEITPESFQQYEDLAWEILAAK